MNNQLNTRTFYILSGEESIRNDFLLAGKESGLDESSFISPDKYRKTLLGSSSSVLGEIIYGEEASREDVNKIIDSIISVRLRQKLPIVFDAPNLSDKHRKIFVDLAIRNGYKPLVVLCASESFTQKDFENNSKYPFIRYTGGAINITPCLVETHKLDIIGDTHGLFSEVISLMDNIGWKYDSYNHILKHSDPERKIMFLGDVLDRGPDSLKLLKMVNNMVDKNLAYFILGNHEDKLINLYSKYKTDGTVGRKSVSSAMTFMNFLAMSIYQRSEIDDFLESTPTTMAVWIDKSSGLVTFDRNNKNIQKFGFIHADNIHFDEYNMPRSHALYGIKNAPDNRDITYQEGVDKGFNKHIVFRGHTFQQSKEKNIFSLEEDQAFNGNLVVLQLDKYISLLSQNNWNPDLEFFEKSTVRYKTEFNFNDYARNNMNLLREMDKLVQEGLATDGIKKNNDGVKVPHPDGFKLYKYSKNVHFKRLWKTNPWIEKARGIVLDNAGNIVVHPFDKLYNFGEYDAGNHLPLNTMVQKIEKLNGFLGCISRHPFRNELLPTTTGSFDSPFVGYIKDFITPELEKKFLKFFNENKMTLMFEVIHKEDPHIIPYHEQDYGLWLIGARGLKLEDQILSETALDAIALELDLKRPKWETVTLDEVIKDMETNETEGCMVRLDSNHEPVMKIKTNYYLITKFIGRIGGKMTEMMYSNPEQFKEHKLDEEFYPLVDKIISSISKEEFSEMPRDQRVTFVRDIVNETRQEATRELVGKTSKLSFKR